MLPCRALLLPGQAWLGPEAVEDAVLGLGLGFGSGLRHWCVNRFLWLLGGGLGFAPSRGHGLRLGMGLGGGGGA